MRLRPAVFAAAAPLALVVALGCGFAGCAPRETAVDAGIRTRTLLIGNSAEPPDLDPQTNNSAAVSWICSALYEGLVRLDNDGVTLHPGVAHAWEISPDGLHYTFHLRADAVWSNGEPVTADDFLASFQRFMNPRVACEAVNYTYPIVGARDYAEGRNPDFASVGIAAPDARTLTIHLRFRAPYFLTVLTDAHFSPVYGPALDRFGGREQRGTKWTEPGNLISNGPFTLSEWQPNVVVAVTKNPRYWNAAAVKLNAIHFLPIEDAGTEERAYRSGQLHITYTLPYNKLATYFNRHTPELVTTPVLQSNYITFGTAQPPFDDVRVRRAFSLAIDRATLMRTVLKGQGEPAYTYVRPGTGGYALPPISRFDPAEAQRLLAEAGYPGGTGFPATEFIINSRAEDKLTYGQALQEMWKQVLGVQVSIVPTEFKVWLDILRNRSFTVTNDGWNMAINDPTDLLALGVTGDPNNDAGWSDPRYDRAFAAIESAPDDDERSAAIRECERLIGEGVPYAPVYFGNRNQLVHPAVRGWQGNPLQNIDWTALSLAR